MKLGIIHANTTCKWGVTEVISFLKLNYKAVVVLPDLMTLVGLLLQIVVQLASVIRIYLLC